MTVETSWVLSLIDQVTPGTKKMSRGIDAVADDIDGLGDEISDLLNDEVDDLVDGLSGLDEGFKGLDEGMFSMSETAEGATEVLSGIFGGLGLGKFSLVTGGFAAVKKGINGVTTASLKFLATPIGAAIAALSIIGIATSAFVQYNEAAAEANMITQQITQLSGDAIGDARVRAQAIENTFGKDFNQTLDQATSLVTAFGITYDEAFDTIEKGMIRGGMANDEFAESIIEYPRLFADAGYSALDFQRIVNTGIDMAIYSDKFPDAIKEFNLSITEGTESSRAALENAFGAKFTNRLFKEVKKGSITAKDALIEISKEVERIGVNSQQAQQLTADLFRGAGEDVGGLEVILEAVNASLIDQEKALTPLQYVLKETADANRDLAKAQAEALESEDYIEFSHSVSVFWTKTKTLWYEGVTYITGLFNDLVEWQVTKFTQFTATVSAVPAVFASVFVDLKNQIFDIIGTFTGLGDIIGKLFKLDFDGAKEDFKKFKTDFSKEVSELESPAKNFYEKLDGVYQTTGEKVKEQFDKNRKGAVAASDLNAQKSVMGTSDKDSKKTNKNGSNSESGLSGSGGSGRSITMNLDIKNYFTYSGKTNENDAVKAAEQIVSKITDRLRDNIIAIG